MDPITALGIAGNVVQFIDFGLKAVSKAREIHASSTGSLVENVNLTLLAEDIAAVTAKLSISTGAGVESGNGSLDDICKRCVEAATELLGALKGMHSSGEKSKWRSARQAVKAMWGRAKVEELRRKLEMWRDEIQFHVLVDLKYAAIFLQIIGVYLPNLLTFLDLELISNLRSIPVESIP